VHERIEPGSSFFPPFVALGASLVGLLLFFPFLFRLEERARSFPHRRRKVKALSFPFLFPSLPRQVGAWLFVAVAPLLPVGTLLSLFPPLFFSLSPFGKQPGSGRVSCWSRSRARRRLRSLGMTGPLPWPFFPFLSGKRGGQRPFFFLGPQ